ncbi:hypothetical protein LPJ66_009271 [Kickxella alabastrina]|uniref:Uncharacterized protein n=1 Tax=Kickxella alabastrina TaxID=61397 RepID=A0ACC1I5A0_9FUNG|nr:hypothetical protein LPJ66_009271 [Kickxella alabastrina]
MPKKFPVENSKVSAAKERKAAAQAEKDSQKRLDKEAKDSAEWNKGAKQGGKKEDQEAKRLERLAKKQEADALLRAEEREIEKSAAAKTGPAKLAPVQPKRQPVLRGAEKKAAAKEAAIEEIEHVHRPMETFAASNIDDALDLFDNIHISTNDDEAAAAVDGAQARKSGMGAVIDRHPERRAKAAYPAYLERELEIMKVEHPGLRQLQMRELIWKSWLKSPENPMNQAQVAYNATGEEMAAAVEEQRRAIQDRLRI